MSAVSKLGSLLPRVAEFEQANPEDDATRPQTRSVTRPVRRVPLAKGHKTAQYSGFSGEEELSLSVEGKKETGPLPIIQEDAATVKSDIVDFQVNLPQLPDFWLTGRERPKQKPAPLQIVGQDLQVPPPKLASSSRPDKVKAESGFQPNLGACYEDEEEENEEEDVDDIALRAVLQCHSVGIPIEICRKEYKRSPVAQPIFHCAHCRENWTASGILPEKCKEEEKRVKGPVIELGSRVRQFIRDVWEQQLASRYTESLPFPKDFGVQAPTVDLNTIRENLKKLLLPKTSAPADAEIYSEHGEKEFKKDREKDRAKGRPTQKPSAKQRGEDRDGDVRYTDAILDSVSESFSSSSYMADTSDMDRDLGLIERAGGSAKKISTKKQKKIKRRYEKDERGHAGYQEGVNESSRHMKEKYTDKDRSSKARHEQFVTGSVHSTMNAEQLSRQKSKTKVAFAQDQKQRYGSQEGARKVSAKKQDSLSSTSSSEQVHKKYKRRRRKVPLESTSSHPGIDDRSHRSSLRRIQYSKEAIKGTKSSRKQQDVLPGERAGETSAVREDSDSPTYLTEDKRGIVVRSFILPGKPKDQDDTEYTELLEKIAVKYESIKTGKARKAKTSKTSDSNQPLETSDDGELGHGSSAGTQLVRDDGTIDAVLMERSIKAAAVPGSDQKNRRGFTWSGAGIGIRKEANVILREKAKKAAIRNPLVMNRTGKPETAPGRLRARRQSVKPGKVDQDSSYHAQPGPEYQQLPAKSTSKYRRQEGGIESSVTPQAEDEESRNTRQRRETPLGARRRQSVQSGGQTGGQRGGQPVTIGAAGGQTGGQRGGQPVTIGAAGGQTGGQRGGQLALVGAGAASRPDYSSELQSPKRGSIYAQPTDSSMTGTAARVKYYQGQVTADVGSGRTGVDQKLPPLPPLDRPASGAKGIPETSTDTSQHKTSAYSGKPVAEVKPTIQRQLKPIEVMVSVSTGESYSQNQAVLQARKTPDEEIQQPKPSSIQLQQRQNIILSDMPGILPDMHDISILSFTPAFTFSLLPPPLPQTKPAKTDKRQRKQVVIPLLRHKTAEEKVAEEKAAKEHKKPSAVVRLSQKIYRKLANPKPIAKYVKKYEPIQEERPISDTSSAEYVSTNDTDPEVNSQTKLKNSSVQEVQSKSSVPVTIKESPITERQFTDVALCTSKDTNVTEVINSTSHSSEEFNDIIHQVTYTSIDASSVPGAESVILRVHEFG